jgi:hypothetical protein
MGEFDIMHGVKLTEAALNLSDRFGRPANAGDAVRGIRSRRRHSQRPVLRALARRLIEEKDVPAIVNHPVRPR